MTTDYFWTDLDQAQQRLQHSIVLYDGQPVYIDRVEAHEDGVPRGLIREIGDDGATSRKKLNSPKFNRFRSMPNLGWVNPAAGVSRYGALYLTRRAVTTRTHGLSVNNVLVENPRFDETGYVGMQGGNYSFANLMFNKGFLDSHNNSFPSLESILQQIQNKSAIAFSRKLCVIRDGDGLRWLFHNKTRIGVFTGVDALSLISRYNYLREEIMAEPLFTLNTIREF